MRIEDGFQPVPFPEHNVYLRDPVLPSLLQRVLPNETFSTIESDLQRLGADIIKVVRPLASSPLVNKPTLTQYDQWGRRVDALHTSEGWRKLKAIAQQEGLPAIFYERQYGEYSRVYGFAKLLLMVGDTQEVFCPLSMTDGAARVLEMVGRGSDVIERLTSRVPSEAFTAGQWMTERPGGSDVSLTETAATFLSQKHPYGDVYSLNGVKWFSSATDSEISIALARTGAVEDGSRGLSLFLVPLRLPLFLGPRDGAPSPVSNNIFVHRLKDKIGTHALPTAELTLQDTRAYLISPLHQGVKSIAPVLNITRVWSAVASTGHLRKCLEIATSYAGVRRIKGGKELLSDNAIHVQRLATVNVLYRALVHLTFGAVHLLGKVECGTASRDEERILRMLTPVGKAFASEKASGGMEEAMAALGGAGYMEENGFGTAIRDGLVEKIWEGTVVVLALDLTRAARDPKTLKAFISWAESVLASCPSALEQALSPVISLLKDGVTLISEIYAPTLHPLIHRPALIVVGYVASSLYLLEHAAWSWTQNPESKNVDVEVLKRWVLEDGLKGAIEEVERTKRSGREKVEMDSKLTFGESPVHAPRVKL